MTGKPGKLLSAEESTRLALVSSVLRDDLIKHIVDGLRAKAKREAKRTSGLRGRR